MNRKERRAAQKRGGSMMSPMAQTLADAFRAHQAGHRSDAERLYRDVLAVETRNAAALHLLGALLHQSGRTDEAISLIHQAIAIEPNNPDYRYNLGTILLSADRAPEAIDQLSKAVSLKPGYADAHFELGSALGREGRFDAAEKSLRRVLELQPGNTNAKHNLGRALSASNRTAEAMQVWQRAVTLQPDLAMTHLNMAMVHTEQNQLDDAEDSLRSALAVNSDVREALDQLALVKMLRGKPEEALPVITRTLAIGEAANTRILFVQCVLALRQFRPEAPLRDLIRRALDEAWTRPNEIAPLCASILKAHPIIGPAIQRIAAQWNKMGGAPELPAATDQEIEAAAREPFFRTYLEATPNCDTEIEHFLTSLRATLLDRARSGAPVSETVTVFTCSLARQCFINEYVFSESETESGRIQQLSAAVGAAIRNGEAIPAMQVVALAAYRPLHTIANAESLLKQGWPDAIAGVLRQQVEEPLQEAALRDDTPALTAIDDTVEKNYEQNPYPRWTKVCSTIQPQTLEAILRRNLPGADIPALKLRPSPQILIAGCGTGLQALEASQSYRDAEILAIDANITNLAYAQRQARAASAPVEFAQADIMKLARLGRSFDVIESAGALNRLAEPFAGWSILLSLLRQGGLMRLGLYSEIARRNIVTARNFVKQGNYEPDAEGIRLFRQHLLRLPHDQEPLKTTLGAADFNTTSGCRDLVFGAHERHTTLPNIQNFLSDNQLEFLGFEITNEVRGEFVERFPGEGALVDLTKWHAFEQDNPNTFLTMYNFWVRKLETDRS